MYFNNSDMIKKTYRPKRNQEDHLLAQALDNDENDALLAVLYVCRLNGWDKSAIAAKKQLIRRGYMAFYDTRIGKNGEETHRIDTSHRVRFAEMNIIDQVAKQGLIEDELQYWTKEGRPKRSWPKWKPMPNRMRGLIDNPAKGRKR